jgi:hypothetical protein
MHINCFSIKFLLVPIFGKWKFIFLLCLKIWDVTRPLLVLGGGAEGKCVHAGDVGEAYEISRIHRSGCEGCYNVLNHHAHLLAKMVEELVETKVNMGGLAGLVLLVLGAGRPLPAGQGCAVGSDLNLRCEFRLE